MRAWKRGLAAAERMAMPHDQGRLHEEIGRHLPDGDPARREHLGRARDLFERIGAADKRLYSYDGHGHEAGRVRHSAVVDRFFARHLQGREEDA